MTRADRHTHELVPGDLVPVITLGGDLWPAMDPRTADQATVLDPPILSREPSWADDYVCMVTLNTDLGPCRVAIDFRWLVAVREARAA